MPTLITGRGRHDADDMATDVSEYEADDDIAAGEDSVRTEERPTKRSQIEAASYRRVRVSEYNSRDMKGKSLLKTADDGK